MWVAWYMPVDESRICFLILDNMTPEDCAFLRRLLTFASSPEFAALVPGEEMYICGMLARLQFHVREFQMRQEAKGVGK
jgi:hypothetical protein